jgi:hypothetical protein
MIHTIAKPIYCTHALILYSTDFFFNLRLYVTARYSIPRDSTRLYYFQSLCPQVLALFAEPVKTPKPKQVCPQHTDQLVIYMRIAADQRYWHPVRLCTAITSGTATGADKDLFAERVFENNLFRHAVLQQIEVYKNEGGREKPTRLGMELGRAIAQRRYISPLMDKI